MISKLALLPFLLGGTALLGPTALGLFPSAPPGEPIGDFRMILEQNSTDGDAEVVVLLDAEEEFDRVSLRGPDRRVILDFRVRGSARELGMKELILESGEPDIPSVLAAFPEGRYVLEARSVSGGSLTGEATLSHVLLDPPVFTPQGAALVDPANAVVTWAAIPGAEGYLLEIEEDDLELNLTVSLPPTATSFVIPEGWLVRDTEYEIGMASITSSGNVNFAESTFVTIP